MKDKSQELIKKAVRDLVKGEFKKEVIHELVERNEYPENIWKKACELGFIGIHFPEKYSGEGLGTFENILVAEELCRGDSSVGACLVRASYGAEMIMRHGSNAQKAAWLPKVAGGDILSCGAFNETGLRNDIALAKTSALRDNNEWLINGTKTFVLNSGPLAGYYIVLCRTDENATSPEQGLSTILVEADRQGVTTSDVGARLGGQLMYEGVVQFDQARVPLTNLVGKENRGFYYVREYLNESRILAAAQAVGIAQGAFDQAFAYVKQRTQFGRKIVEFQITRQKLADMATKLESARLLTYQAAWLLDNGHNDGKLSSMAKLQAARTAVEVCDEAIQLLGGYGYIQEYDIERYFRDAKVIEIYEGTREAQKNIISNELLKRRSR
jgi:alkylation response protein AidB-like acyl-CoA dehydrogenase